VTGMLAARRSGAPGVWRARQSTALDCSSSRTGLRGVALASPGCLRTIPPRRGAPSASPEFSIPSVDTAVSANQGDDVNLLATFRFAPARGSAGLPDGNQTGATGTKVDGADFGQRSNIDWDVEMQWFVMGVPEGCHTITLICAPPSDWDASGVVSTSRAATITWRVAVSGAAGC
jgi:hypothetical protein